MSTKFQISFAFSGAKCFSVFFIVKREHHKSSAESKMWIKSFLLIFVVTCSVKSDEKAKVEQVDSENSTVKINYIKYTNNGAFNEPNKVIKIHQVTTSQEPQLVTQCGGIFRNLQNLIESPKYVSSRPICNLRCEYQIVSPYICENDFHVQFLDFAIDSSPDCENDRVIINYSEILCGKIIGVKKFRTSGGVLNITFSSRLWDSKQEKGFRLLVTRLPCVEPSNQDQTEVGSLEPSAPTADNNEDRCFNVNSSYTVSNPSYGQGHPIYGVPVYNETMVRGRQDIPVLPLPSPVPPFQPPFYPPTSPNPIGPVNPILPPQFLPRCCRNEYNQQRFLMISQGFPSSVVRNNDCIYAIQRSSPNVCRLRIIFKYFLLDDPQPVAFGCINNFIEIDGQRICGCKTNFVYETQWGYEPVKIIRIRTLPGSFTNVQGFVFEIIQEACPYKIQQNEPLKRQARHLNPEKFLLHPFLTKSHQQPDYSLIPSIKQFKDEFHETFKSKFYKSDQSFINNVCYMNHFKLLQLKVETFGIAKHYCIPFY